MSSPLAPARTRPVDVNALLERLTARDPHTARHSVAVARYAGNLAVALGASDEERRLVHTAGLLHDVRPQVRRLLEVTGLDDRFELETPPDEP